MKILHLLLGLCLVVSSTSAQTLLFGGANGNGDFENGSTGWTIVNGNQANKWVVSSNATPGFSGSNSIYISSSSAAPYSHTYSTNAPSESYFYRDVAIPAGTVTGYLVFDYISNGDWATDAFGTMVHDGFMINIRNTSTTVMAESPLPGVTFLDVLYYNQPTWKKKQVRYLDVAPYAGTTIRLIFQWTNNTNGGNQTPAAIDNIEMYTSCEEICAPTVSEISTNTANLVGSIIQGDTGYKMRHKKADDPAAIAKTVNEVIGQDQKVKLYPKN